MSASAAQSTFSAATVAGCRIRKPAVSRHVSPLSAGGSVKGRRANKGATPIYSLRGRVASEAVRWRDQGTIQRGGCFAAGCGLWGGRWRLSGTDYGGDSGPIVYGPVGINAPARWRIKVASEQAAAKARRTRDATSMTRTPSFKSRRRRVVNSEVASACVRGMASRTVSRSQ